MILGSKTNNGYRVYCLEMDEAEFNQAIKGEPIYHVTVSNKIVGEWTVRFKKFSGAKMRRMNLI